MVVPKIVHMIHSAIATTSYNTSPIDEYFSNNTTENYFSTPSTPLPTPTVHHPIKLVVTSIQLLLVLIGSVNLLVIYIIISRPYIRSITNVYLACLCISNFIYLSNLTFVVATQLNEKSWPFGQFLCTTYHSMESTSKYSSVLFVVLLSIDRYIVMCLSTKCRRYRNYRIAICASVLAVFIAILASLPLYIYSGIAYLPNNRKLCVVKWPTISSPTWYICITSVLIFGAPSCLIVFTYFHVYKKLKDGLKNIKRLKLTNHRQSRKSYQRVTTFVLWTILFHTICWCPFWFFNLISAIFRIQIVTPSERMVLNMIHLLPYMNCALNPIVYAANAKNFRQAFCSMFTRNKKVTSVLKKQAAVIIRRPDSSSGIEKKLYLCGTQPVNNPTIHHLFTAAANCAEVAGVELDLNSYREEENFSGEIEMVVPEIHWEVESPSSDEATEGATSWKHSEHGTPNTPSIFENLSRRVSTLSRTISNAYGADSNHNGDRRDSRRHTLTLSAQLLMVPFSVQLAKGRGSVTQLDPVSF